MLLAANDKAISFLLLGVPLIALIIFLVILGIRVALFGVKANKAQKYLQKLEEENMDPREKEMQELMNLKSDLEHGRPVLDQPKKDASVVGRAVAGGVIAGPVGAVVGAISAADKNNRQQNKK